MDQKKEIGLSYLDPSEIRILLDRTATMRDRLLVLLLYELGCTLKELVALRVRDVVLETGSINISKAQTKRCERQCLVSESTRGLLSTYLSEEGLNGRKLAYVFSSSHGGHMTVRRVTQRITSLLKQAGFADRAHPQVLKYSHIVNAYHANVPVAAIHKQVGLTKHRLVSILLEIDQDSGLESYSRFLK
ncbi:MAG: tyrosine-type recombinase/integrase [Nanobdellota archaeon]